MEKKKTTNKTPQYLQDLSEKLTNSLFFRIFKGWLWWFAGEFVCIIFTICMILVMRRFMAVRIFVAFSALILTNGLYFNYALNWANHDRNAVKFHHGKQDSRMSLKMAFLAPLPQYIMWFILLLSKLGAIMDIFNYYILANIQCIAWVDLFTDKRTIDAVSPAGMGGLLLLILISSATIFITYECVYREIDVKALLMYGKKK